MASGPKAPSPRAGCENQKATKRRLLVPSPTLPAPWWPNQADGSPQLLPIYNSGAVGIVPCASCLWTLAEQGAKPHQAVTPLARTAQSLFAGSYEASSSITSHHPSPITRLAPLSPLRCRPEALLSCAALPCPVCSWTFPCVHICRRMLPGVLGIERMPMVPCL